MTNIKIIIRPEDKKALELLEHLKAKKQQIKKEIQDKWKEQNSKKEIK